MKQEITITSNQYELEKRFEYVNSLIGQHRSSVIVKVNEIMQLRIAQLEMTLCQIEREKIIGL